MLLKHNKNQYTDVNYISTAELAKLLSSKSADDIVPFLFEHYGINCINMHKINSQRLDTLIEELKYHTSDKEKILSEIISLVRSVTNYDKEEIPVIELIKKNIQNNLAQNLSLEKLADMVGISKYYMCHLFKSKEKISIKNYEKMLRLSKAKEYLIKTDKSITNIAYECGYENASYFSKIFMEIENISPGKYRKLQKYNEYRSDNMNLEHIDLLKNVDTDNLLKINNMKSYTVSLPSEEYNFLHEAAIIEYHGILFAAWYNNKKCELYGETPIRFSISIDKGQTWSKPYEVINDKTGKILYCPPVFGICDDKLYMFINQMVSADHIHSLDLYEYDGKKFNLKWSKQIPFKCNTNVYSLPNGKLILPGRVGEIDEFPNTPAVLISDSGKIDAEWRLVKIQNDGIIAGDEKYVHPEVSLVVCSEKLYAFCRNDANDTPIIYISDDFGESWSKPLSHDIPFSNSKIYSGTLSDGRNYVIGNLDSQRTKLAIFFSKIKSMKFTKGFMLQDGISSSLGFGDAWHYPSAVEFDGKLYVIYTFNKNDRGAAISELDISEI